MADSFDAALDAASNAPEIAVIGGASIYGQALPLATRMYLTRVHTSIVGDVSFPEFEPGNGGRSTRAERSADPRNPFDLSFIELTRIPPKPAQAAK